MTDGLFSEVDLGSSADLPGYRLARLEVFNWGTFNQHVWSIDVDSRNALLTGDIGSGKSTLVDAVTTLLLPSNRISYNKAAGAENRERDLRSYVRGHYKTARDETRGTSYPVALRDGSTFSVILGVFANRGYGRDVTLAQVFWLREGASGQPDRFFVSSDSALSLATDFGDFGGQIPALKKRLRTRGVEVFDRFGEYSRAFRRSLGIASEQAMELFHQTVSMKAVGDLNDFVRSHMLESFDAADHVAQVVAHFDDLNKAHASVVRARRQLELLTPMLVDGDEYERVESSLTHLRDTREKLAGFFAHHRARLLTIKIEDLSANSQALDWQIQESESRLREIGARRDELMVQRSELGGDRLGAIERELSRAENARNLAQKKFEEYNSLRRSVGLDGIADAAGFSVRRAEIPMMDGQLAIDLEHRKAKYADLLADDRSMKADSERINTELRSLRSRTSNISKSDSDLRDLICAERGLAPSDLPFAGELIAVRDDSLGWEGAAERLLRGFAMSVLVPQQHYGEVSAWINDRNLNKRIVYYRVAATRALSVGQTPGPGSLFEKLKIKEGPHFGWLEAELARRASLRCVETMEEFRSESRAITRQGQIKGGQGRHEKDDRFAIDDRGRYLLGWANERKIEALLAEATDIQSRYDDAAQSLHAFEQSGEEINLRRRQLSALDQTKDYGELDWQRQVGLIADLQQEQCELETASDALQQLAETLKRVEAELAEEESVRGQAGQQRAVTESERKSHASELVAATDSAAKSEVDAADAFEGDLADTLVSHTPTRIDDCQARELAAERELGAEIDAVARASSLVVRRLQAKMSTFRQHHPVEARDLDDSVGSLVEYRVLHARIADDDLPRFEAEFKQFLNTNTIRDIASFYSRLTQQEELIRQRVARINDSLVAIDYNEGRYIRLESAKTPNKEIRQFQDDLLACTAGAASGNDSDQYSEQKFLQVKAILERFKGREGLTDLDRKWTRTVTDVRHWLTFSASERWREDDSEHEHYTDSGGKSGGQKEKLAYTVLAASLAYQFGLEWGVKRSHNFQFVVIDEAFGRGSDESSRFALELFGKLGLQLLIVTPLQKIQVIEPYVSTVGLVSNPDGSDSRLQVLTIEEYAQRKRLHALGDLVEEGGA